jgi:hypothetical protein
VKFPEKGLGTMAAIWPSTERVNYKYLFISGIENLYDIDIKLNEEQRELVDAGADPSTATKEIKIKRGKKPSNKDLEKAYKKKRSQQSKAPNRKGTAIK